MTSWELIFLQSRVNKSGYDGDDLPAQKWDWPRGTWFQKRLHHLRAKFLAERVKVAEAVYGQFRNGVFRLRRLPLGSSLPSLRSW